MSALSRKLKYSRTYVYAPFSIYGTPFERLNELRSDAKSRNLRGTLNLI